MLLSFYYSCPDWNCDFGFNPTPGATHQWIAKNKENPDMNRYIQYVKNQITELLTNYGKIYTLFWDIPPRIIDRSVNELARKLQPDIYINDRGFDEGDFSTPERDYSELSGARFEKMTEACNSIGEQSWGYMKNEDFHTIRYLTTSIDKVMARGGSYLLNVGPDKYGVISDDYLKRLKKVGDWYNRMGGCLEQTDADTFDYEIKKNKFIVNTKDGKSYFHFYEGLSSSAISFKKFPCEPKSVVLVNTGKKLGFKVEVLPEYHNFETGIADHKYLHIFGVPADELVSEPIVIEIEW